VSRVFTWCAAPWCIIAGVRAASTWALIAGVLLLVAGVLVAPQVLDGRAGPGGLPPVAASSGIGGLPRGAPQDDPARARSPSAPATARTRTADREPGAGSARASASGAAAARGASTSGAARTPSAPLTDARAIEAARRFAAGRAGTVAFAVLDSRGRLRGLRRTLSFPSASVSKAMLLVAALRAAPDRPLTPAERAVLGPMVVESDNDAAEVVFGQVGDPGLVAVARAAGMRRFTPVGHWSDAGLTPADQARLFLRIDGLVPARHRTYARKLLGGIVSWQRWGIPEAVARRPGAAVLFKGGWRPGLTHQVALVEREGTRIALAVLTRDGPDVAYDQDTIAGIARRVLLAAPRSG